LGDQAFVTLPFLFGPLPFLFGPLLLGLRRHLDVRDQRPTIGAQDLQLAAGQVEPHAQAGTDPTVYLLDLRQRATFANPARPAT